MPLKSLFARVGPIVLWGLLPGTALALSGVQYDGQNRWPGRKPVGHHFFGCQAGIDSDAGEER